MFDFKLMLNRIGWIFNKKASVYISKSIVTGGSVNDALIASSHRSSAEMISKYLDIAQLFFSRPDLYAYLFTLFDEMPNGMNLEFGVHKGGSLKIFSKKLNYIYGFDSFLGLEENWSYHFAQKGSLNLNGKIPDTIKDLNNVKLIVGRVEDTLDEFISRYPLKISFIHMDLDLYSPTKHCLERLKHLLQSGSIILFDEFHGYPGWEFHEYRAFMETFEKKEYDILAFSEMQCIIRIR
jgi:hypothetical protein